MVVWTALASPWPLDVPGGHLCHRFCRGASVSYCAGPHRLCIDSGNSSTLESTHPQLDGPFRFDFADPDCSTVRLEKLKVSSFSEFYSQSLLVLLVCTVCTMWFFLAIALVLELFYGLKAKDSAILRVFESRGQDLGEMLVAIARALQQEEVSQATLQRVFDRMNNHDLSRLETSLELLLTGFMGLNTGLQVPSMNSTRWRIQERAISRASVLPTGTAGAALPEDSESKMDMVELDPDLPIPDEFAEPIQGAECLR